MWPKLHVLKYCDLFGLGLERPPQVAVNLVQKLLGIPRVKAFEQHHTGGFNLPIAGGQREAGVVFVRSGHTLCKRTARFTSLMFVA